MDPTPTFCPPSYPNINESTDRLGPQKGLPVVVQQPRASYDMPPPNQFICFRTLYYAKVAELDRLMARMNPGRQKRRQPEHSTFAGRIWGQPEFDQTPWRDMYAELLVKYRANKAAYEQAVLEGRPTMSLAVQEAVRKASGRRQQARRRTNTAAAPEAGMGWDAAEESRPAKRRRTGGQYGTTLCVDLGLKLAMAAPYYNFDVSTDRPTSYTPTLHQWGPAPPLPFPGPSFDLIHPTPSQMAQQHLPYVDPYRSAPAHLPASYSQDNHYFPNLENVPAPPPAVPAPSFNFLYPMPSQTAQHLPQHRSTITTYSRMPLTSSRLDSRMASPHRVRGTIPLFAILCN
ncbi:hypothetical protein C8T65DRAFT_696416 [Cerioporus squamosus]|nr:hypothetical protein C8T65DRAFT_696416 [Cerioporus squamosus]